MPHCRATRNALLIAALSGLISGSPSAAQTAPSVLQMLNQQVQQHGDGFEPVTPSHMETLTSDARLEREVRLEMGRCYRVIAAANAAVRDLQLTLIGPRGRVVQRDTTRHGTPTLGVLRPLCPARAGLYKVRIRSAPDAGSVAWRVLGSTSQRASEPTPRARFAVGGTGNGYLAQHLRQRHAQVADGKPPRTDRLEHRHARSEQVVVPLPVRAGHCYVAIAAGQPSIRQIQLQIVDAHGQERGRGAASEPSAAFCATTDADYQVRVKVELGYGTVALQVYGSRR